MAQQPIDVRSLLAHGAQMGPSSWAATQGRPVAISFGGGLPDPSSFPIDDLAAAAEGVLRRDGAAALQYGGLYGYEGLRDYLIERALKDDGIAVEREQVALTSGSSQAISLACFAFVNPGDTVIVEAPTFAGSLRAIRAYGANLLSIPLDEEGLQVELLEKELAQLQAQGVRPKLIYTIPNFHNPAGVTLSLERRRRLVEIAQAAGMLILEDDAYGDLRYEGARLPSLQSLDERGVVIKLGSFSKVLAAGLRLGWAVGHVDAIAAMTSVRHDMGVSPFLARTVAEYAMEGRLEGHIQRLVALYRDKRDLMVTALGEYCGPSVTWRRPEGGFFVWLELAPGVNPNGLAGAAADEGVGYVPGAAFYVDEDARRHIRLAFSYVPSADIEKGIAGLGRALERSRSG